MRKKLAKPSGSTANPVKQVANEERTRRAIRGNRMGDPAVEWVGGVESTVPRDLVRARAAAAFDLKVKRQQTGAVLLHPGRVYSGKKSWGGAHRKWLANPAFPDLELRVAFEELLRRGRGQGARRPAGA